MQALHGCSQRIAMACWSPLDAMDAYVHTLHLCRDLNCSKQLVEPECVEFISALAAGSQARLMVDVASGGMSPSALALAIAARRTGGRLVCVCRDQESIDRARSAIEGFKLGDVVGFEAGDPCEVIRRHGNIDFAVVDSRIDGCEELLFAMDMNPNGSVVVLSNLFEGRRRSRVVGQRREGSVETAVLPIGNGMEVTKIGRRCRTNSGKKSKRTFLVYEE